MMIAVQWEFIVAGSFFSITTYQQPNFMAHLKVLVIALCTSLSMLVSIAFSSTPGYQQGVVLVKFRSEAEAFLNTPKVSPSLFRIPTEDLGIEKIVPMFAAHNVYFNALHAGRNFSSVVAPKHDALSRMYIVHIPTTSDVIKVSRTLSKDPFVEYAEPRSIQSVSSYTPNDSLLSKQGHLVPIKATDAWGVTKGDSTVIIGIDDSGTQWDHPDLINNIYINPGETGTDANGNDKRTNGIDDDGNGYIDDYHGWDFAGTDGKSPDNNPINGQHGTHVAGLAGARTDNGIGVAGTGFRCKIMPIKTAMDFKESQGILFGYEAMVYAADNGASVINCSWGGGGSSTADQETIDYVTAKGALLVVAYGNNSKEEMGFPGSYNHVLGVTSTNNSDRASSFTSYGQRADVASPGDFDYSTYPTNAYASLGGTSMASPVAAGVCALVKSRFPELTPDQIGERVRVTADVNDAKYDAAHKKLMGRGRLNAFRAVSDSNLKSIRIDSVKLQNLTSADGFNPGDTILVTIRFKNYLDPTGQATTSLVNYKNSAAIVMISPSSTVGAMSTLETKFADSSYKIAITQNAPPNMIAKFRVDIVDGAYNDYDYFEFLVRPTFKNFDQNAITATVTSNGSIAFNDLAASQGIGFLFHNSDNLLFEGSFMVGIDATHVVDVARSATSGATVKDADFSERTLLNILTPGESGTAQSGRCVFTDSLAPSANKIGVTVSSFAYEKTTPGLENVLFVEQTITNTRTTAIGNLYAGYFFDWDIGTSGANNVTQFHQGCNFASVTRDSNASKIGVTVIPTSQTLPINFYAFDNGTVNDGFTKAEKWTALSSGTTASPKKGPADISHVIGAGPFTLAPNESVTIPFALFAGGTLDELRLTANKLRNETCDPIGVTETAQDRLSSALENYPNPFSSETSIHISFVSHEDGVSLVVHDALGRTVRELFSGRSFDQGRYEVPFETANLAQGVYEYTLITSHGSISRRMVLAR